MKITIYELLGMIKDGKAPKRIKSEGHYYNYNKMEKDYYEGMGYDYEYLIKNTPNDRLNDEIEIIEEKKIPEKLHHCCTDTDNEDIEFLIKNINDFVDRYNELLDYLKEKENKYE